MFWFAELNRISNQAYRNHRIRFVVDDDYIKTILGVICLLT